MKLPCLYLMDSIMKNHGDPYRELFAHNVVFSFSHVFQSSDVKVRSALHKLRLTWTEVFPTETLHQLDVKVQSIDPKWPVAAMPTKKIHINPAIFNKGRTAAPAADSEEAIQRKLKIMELEKQRLELELQIQKATSALNEKVRVIVLCI